MAEKPNEQEVDDLNRKVRQMFAGSGLTFAEAAQILNERYGMNESSPSISRYLKAGNFPYWKLVRLTSVLGYDLQFVKTDNSHYFPFVIK